MWKDFFFFFVHQHVHLPSPFSHSWSVKKTNGMINGISSVTCSWMVALVSYVHLLLLVFSLTWKQTSHSTRHGGFNDNKNIRARRKVVYFAIVSYEDQIKGSFLNTWKMNLWPPYLFLFLFLSLSLSLSLYDPEILPLEKYPRQGKD